ncbi:MAG: hypothetical protein JO069_11870 [Verrucomicrobia bacterium]|nr:hypothetical protein [Verrucomicrobiota bacterium]
MTMTELAVENSTERGSLAVAVEGHVIHTASFQGSNQLALAVASARRKTAPFARVIIGTGPGSYTGLRVAAATGLGLQVALRCELVGCPSVLGFAHDNYGVVGNARRGSYFLALIRSRRIVEGPRLVPAGELAVAVAALSPAPCFAVTPVPETLPVPIVYPQAEYLLVHSSSWVRSVEPLYLKEPHVTGPDASRVKSHRPRDT